MNEKDPCIGNSRRGPRAWWRPHEGRLGQPTTEQIERGIELIKEMLAQREAGANAKVVEDVRKLGVR